MIRIFKNGVAKLFRTGTIGAHLHALSAAALNGVSSSSYLAQGCNWVAGTGVAAWTTTLDVLYVVPFVSPARGGLLHMVGVSTFNAGGNIRMGIYANKLDIRDIYPDELLWESPSLVTGAKDNVAIADIQLDPNRIYWAAVVTEQARGMYDSANYGSGHLMGMDASATTTCIRAYTVAHTFGALPDPFPASAAFSAPHPLIKLRYM